MCQSVILPYSLLTGFRASFRLATYLHRCTYPVIPGKGISSCPYLLQDILEMHFTIVGHTYVLCILYVLYVLFVLCIQCAWYVLCVLCVLYVLFVILQ